MIIDISKYNKSDVLVELFNHAKPQGLGNYHYSPKKMTREDAIILLNNSKDWYFDYLEGRVMKVDLSGDTLNTALYDRDNGEGAAEAALKVLGE